MRSATVSVVVPARNEALTIARLCRDIQTELPDAELIVVDDGSSDGCGDAAAQAGARVVSHPHSLGNGAAIKSGARVARGNILVFLDGDGQHDAQDIPRLLAQIDAGHDLVVGARQTRGDQASLARWGANQLYNRLASVLVGHPVDDLTSGFRAVVRSKFLAILALLPNGFSYPTTSTMAFYRAGHSVSFVPIAVRQRPDKTGSHIRPLRDGLRFLTIIFKVVTLYSPLKVFAPASLAIFVAGIGYYAYTYLSDGRFTNMGMLLLLSAMLVFLIGLLSEQVTTLIHLHLQDAKPRADDEPPP